MAFHEVQFPVDISFGSRGGPGYKTEIITTDSGHEHRVSRWSSPRHKYQVSYGLKTHAQLDTLRRFYMARQGAAHGFRYKDFADFTTASDGRSACSDTDVNIGTGDGAEKQFQLRKLYSSGGVSQVRNIKKPVALTTVVSIDDVSQTSGWSVDPTSGIVTFTAAPLVDEVVKAGCDFDTPVRFAASVDNLMEVIYENASTSGVRSVGLVEIVDDDAVLEDFPYGGAGTDNPMEADITLSLLAGRVRRFNPDDDDYSIILPPISTMPSGGIHFYLFNLSGSFTVAIVEDASDGGGTVATLAVNGTKWLVAHQNAAGQMIWGAM